MAGRECYHCKQWIEEGEAHECWKTTEAALTQDLSEDLQDAWERLRETAVSFGDQRIYASHKSLMFSRKSWYFFVRPKRNFLELCVFLGRTLKAPQVRRVDRASKAKLVYVIQIKHRDEVEAPITDWLQEAYELSDVLASKADATHATSPQTRMVASGVKAKLTCIDVRKLDPSFAGREFDETFLSALPDGVDPCGERGEFHSFVYAGPMLDSPVSVAVGETVVRNHFAFADLVRS